MVMLGFGSIGQGVLPLLLRHIETLASQLGVQVTHTELLPI